MQKLKLKQKKKEKQEQKQELIVKQKVALHALQKQLQVLRLKEWLVMAGFVGGASFLRSAMQPWPNVEPLTFFALLAGWLFGKKKGFFVGISSLYISNFFVFGGQGPWTIYQVIGYGIAGFVGGFLRKEAKIFETVIAMFLATIILQIIFNIGWGISMGFNILLAFITSIPFMITHLVSNSIFGLFLPSAKKFVNEKGRFDEKEICINVLNRFRNHPVKRWLPGRNVRNERRF